MKEFETKRELLYFVAMTIFLGLFLTCLAIMLLLSPVYDDLVNQVIDNRKTIDNLSIEANKYKIMYEEYYNMYESCLENGGSYVCQSNNILKEDANNATN